MRASALFCFFIIIAAGSASFAVIADDSFDWAKTLKSDGMAVTFIHRTSIMDAKAKTSAVSIYKIPAQESDIVKFHDTLADKAVASVASEYAPAKCFRLNRKDLYSHQTWCDASSKWLIVVAESGPVVMSEAVRVAFTHEQITKAQK